MDSAVNSGPGAVRVRPRTMGCLWLVWGWQGGKLCQPPERGEVAGEYKKEMAHYETSQ
ncbi:MAG: hypothetical protein SO369_08235 [Treponema sp.]|nr:hypothetical protein [Treponema sp.]